MFRSRKARLALAVPVAIGAAVLVADPALAGVTVRTTGASLMCNVYQTGTFTGYADCRLTDTLSDSRQVYAVTRVQSFPSRRVTSNGGDGTTLQFRENIHGDQVTWSWSYKVCRKVNLGSDNCSSWQKVQA